MKYDKKFLIIGHQNAIKYKEIFPLIKANKLWLGYGFRGGAAHFINQHYEDYATAGNHREGMIRVSGVTWFTNLDIKKRHEEYVFIRKYRPEDYPTYENYAAIDVSESKDIPEDWYGEMGGPITFLDKYNPEQFEIVGIAEGDSGRSLGLRPVSKELKKVNPSLRDGQFYLMRGGKPVKPFSRMVIRRRRKEATA